MRKINFLVLINLLLILPVVHAETILVGAGNEGEVYTQESNETINTSSGVDESLITYLQSLQSTVDEKEYLKALNERDKIRTNENQKIIKSLEKTTTRQLKIIQDQKNNIDTLQSDLTKTKETLNTRIVQLEAQTERQNYWTMFSLVACLIITVLIVEYIHALTRRKKLFFKLRKFRDEFPINPGVILGGRE